MVIEPSKRISVVAAALSADVRTAARMAREAGFGGLQFDAVSKAFDATDLSQSGLREFSHILSSQGQQLVGLRYDVGQHGLRPGVDVDRLLWQMSKVMAAAAGLRAPLVCVEVGPLPEPPAKVAPRPKVNPDLAGLLILPPTVEAPPPQPAEATPAELAHQASVDTAMAALAQRCDQAGVTLAFRSELSSFAALLRAVQGPRCPWFAIDLDPVALLRDAWSADEVFSQIAPLIRHVRARDAAVGSDRRTKPLPIGRGDTKWDELLANLEAAGYGGVLTVDPLELTDRLAGASAGLAYLRTKGL
ncbi:MAG TPA: TIM barrel protein [Tepidisphaeraceae bacterium]|jgi:sugar phosphate isomerase/epimerase|nr:TIM barrel protein [Tepidisphaeraceae bacterium]